MTGPSKQETIVTTKVQDEKGVYDVTVNKTEYYLGSAVTGAIAIFLWECIKAAARSDSKSEAKNNKSETK